MSKDFDFDAWVSKFKFRKETIEKLLKEAYTDEVTLPYLCDPEQLKQLKLHGGELIRLKRAVAETFENEIRLIALDPNLDPFAKLLTPKPEVTVPPQGPPLQPGASQQHTGVFVPPTPPGNPDNPASGANPPPVGQPLATPPGPSTQFNQQSGVNYSTQGASAPSGVLQGGAQQPFYGGFTPGYQQFGGFTQQQYYLPTQPPLNVHGQVTTNSLGQDRNLNAQVDAYLQGGVGNSANDLLTLGDLQQRNPVNHPQTSASSGEPKPLLISDFLSSNFKVSYWLHEDKVKVPLGNGAEIVVNGQKRKPSLSDYTPELWNAANNRIIQYLFRIGTPATILFQYSEYSQMINDYLGLYFPRGVYLLDYEHRWKVAREGRPWNLICFHDKDRFLVFNHSKDLAVAKALDSSDSSEKSSSKKSKKTGGKTKRTKVLDNWNRPICFNFNSTEGCESDPPESCKYSHHCIVCKGNHSKVDCPDVPPRLRGK